MINPYFTALNLTPDASLDDVKKAYAVFAAELHPDKPAGDAEKFALLTEAFNQIKRIFAKKRGRVFGSNGDEAWLRAWTDLNKPAPRAEEPKAEEPKAEEPKGKSYAAAHPTGTKSDSSRRCGTETRSGACIRPFNHPHGHMSARTKDAKIAAQKAKQAAAKAAAAAAA
jgi:curved DNA-binding protein CbpA